MTLFGDVGGIEVRTTRPFALELDDDIVESGEADFVSADVIPFVVLLGDDVNPPVPARLHAVLGREGGAPLVTLSGHLADNAVQAKLSGRSMREVSGAISLDRLSIPWLVATFALHPVAEARRAVGWSTARFGQPRTLEVAVHVGVKVRSLELGRGLAASDASFNLAIDADGLAVRDLATALAGGRLTARFLLTRQGSRAAIDGEGTLEHAALRELDGAAAFGGRLSASLHFGASGESVAALVANLRGGGTLTVSDLEVPDADPAALERVLGRARAEFNLLAPGRLQVVATEELSRGPLRAWLSAPVTLSAGLLRLSPAAADAGEAVWRGAVAFDAGTMRLAAHGALGLQTAPSGWIGSPPHIGLSWSGPLAAPLRQVDAAPLASGVAALTPQAAAREGTPPGAQPPTLRRTTNRGSRRPWPTSRP